MRLNDLITEIEQCEYPTGPEGLALELDDPVIEYQTGSESVSTVLERVDIHEFEDPEAAVLMVLSLLDADAIGRRKYSDRDPPVLDEGQEPSHSI